MIEISQDFDRCNNKATRVDIGNHAVFFSYKTAIAYRGPLGDCRIQNYWGNTTGRHFSAMGVRDLPVVDQEELKDRLRKIG